jgi:hypothetical protein
LAATLQASTIRIHPVTVVNPGTVGCVLQGTPPGGVLTRYFLTCAHVAGAPGPARPGAELLAMDGAKIGSVLNATNSLVDGIDVAVAELAINMDPTLGGLGMPRGWTWLIDQGTRMRAVTATTAPGQFIDSTIRATDQTLTIDFDLPGGNTAPGVLHNMILADLGLAGGPQLGEGDSGSILIDEYGLIVGIHAGATPDGQAIITPIQQALDALSALVGFTLEPVIDSSPFPVFAPPSAATIGTIPGTNAPRGIRNNNPGNVEYQPSNAWIGLADPPSDKRFCRFTDIRFGIRVMCELLEVYQNKYQCESVRQLISKWAPPNENDTEDYISNVATKLGVKADAPVIVSTPAIMTELVKAIIKQENGEQPYDDTIIDSGLAAAGLK